MTKSSSTEVKSAVVSWIALAALMTLCAAATGRLNAKRVADTNSYLAYPFDSLDAALRSTRTVGYPAMLWCIEQLGGIQLVPFFQILLHATAAMMLIRELDHWGTPASSRWAAGLAIAFGCTALDNVAVVATDAPAASLGVMTAVSLMAWSRKRRSMRAAASVILFGLATIAIRPAYLAMMPWIVIAGTLLLYRRSHTVPTLSLGRSIASSTVLAVLISLPLMGWVVTRGLLVSDYAFLPFGHQNLAGITVQLVNEKELLALPGNSGALTKEILAVKQRLKESGFEFAPGNRRATMTIEGRWNDYVWRVIAPAANNLHPNDSIGSHHAVGELNREIIGCYPLRYLRWLVLGARRAIWGTAANISMHPVFLACLAIGVGLECSRILRGVPALPSHDDDGTRMLFLIAVTYFAVHVGFVILTSPPLGRFADATAIFLPAWFLARWNYPWQLTGRTLSP